MKSQELGRPYVSTRRLPVRRVYRGGGQLDASATQALAEPSVKLDAVVCGLLRCSLQ